MASPTPSCCSVPVGASPLRLLGLSAADSYNGAESSRRARLKRQIRTHSMARGVIHFGSLSRQLHCAASMDNGSPWDSENGDNAASWTSMIGKAADGSLQQRPLQVVLVSPQIPGNTGTIARTCAAVLVGLHLVKPLGFSIEDTKLKRAGLDYWPYIVVKVHESWPHFLDYFRQQECDKRLIAFTKRGKCSHLEMSYRPGDWLVFGSETDGLAPEIHQECLNGLHAGGTARIPINETYVRSLNLGVSVGVGLYEALRQLEVHHGLKLDDIQNDTTIPNFLDSTASVDGFA